MVSVDAFGFPNSDCAFQLEAVRRCYERGVGVIEDHVEAFRWYCKSAEQLYHTAEYSLAECFKHGRGVPRNEATAIEWYTKAAKHGLAQVRKLHGLLGICCCRWDAMQAQNDLGVYFQYGMLGCPVDHAASTSWYEKAAEQVFLDMRDALSIFLTNRTKRETAKAWPLSLMLHVQGLAVAAFNLGVLYQQVSSPGFCFRPDVNPRCSILLSVQDRQSSAFQW